ncbi:hypothetical protein ACHAWT_008335 [Skeletonema menzelii]|mmetsp:Transcript_1631/g.2747  ORF Transcript_1631/g.2747 Transcript_1631/m.2747 type:complete len:280 (+) Transcript_1631:37-876(+)
MPSSVSFLQAASAKISAIPAPLQLLLVEDENKTLSYSLAMDAAYSLASSPSPPSMQCRGCGFSEHSCCRCCKVAMLVARWNDQNNQGQQQNNRKNETDMPFPLWCYQEGTKNSNDDESSRERDQSALNQIQIKYVNSIEDVIRYLTYSPSLPQHLVPLEGIFLLGLGDLISLESAGIMELTNILSILSDTGFVLDKLRSDIGSSNSLPSTTLVATLNQQIYSSLPQTVYKRLGYTVASTVQSNSSNSNATTCELVFEDSSSRNSFTFTKNDDDEIVWSV